MKLLVLGNTQSVFINQLYGDIKLKDDKFIFDIDKSKGSTKRIAHPDTNIFRKSIDIRNFRVNKFQLLLQIVINFFNKQLWKEFIFEISQGEKLNSLKRKIYEFVKYKYIAKKYILPSNYDIFHFHFCTPTNLILAKFLPSNARIIMSFWGSDLLRHSGSSNVFYVRQALKKANRITVQSAELAEFVAVKYGRDLRKKIIDLRFTLSTAIYDNIDLFQQEKKQLFHFKNKYGIEQKDKIVAIGHNAFKENNHFSIMDVIKEIPEKELQNLTFILHIGYGGNDEYISMLKDRVKKEKIIKYVIIEEFLNPLEIANLRMITDVLIQMPVSDALSAAMTEVLYAGNSVIAGAWLPYGILRRKGVVFSEVEKFDELPLLLTDLVKGETNSLYERKNKKAIKSFLFPNTTTSDWINLFKNVNISEKNSF